MRNLRVNLMVRDVQETVSSYQDVFGAEVIASVPEGDALAFALVRIGAIELMFETEASLSEDIPALQQKELGGTFTLYIDVDDVITLYNDVREKVTIVKELHETFYGTREFYMSDLNGYIIAFAQKLDK